ncbi:MAG: FAD-binding protein [Coriobacteriales bacterium]|jgi:succinate dehydrogenase/fumarate reductase flavoprotein subunit|nr:FAD-binding protein [Coriobacteriales bacterium]
MGNKGRDANALSRREFLRGAAIAGTATAGAVALGGCSTEAQESKRDWMPEVWDAETDILVIGCGGAGVSAGITAKVEALGEVLVLEAAPEEFEGGNTRVSSQVMFIPDDVEGAITYQRNLNAGHVVDDELLRAWAENIVQNLEWLEGLGLEIKETSAFSPEWPSVEESEHCHCYLVEGAMGNEILWKELREVATENELEVRHGTRAKELIYNPETREVLGVRAETPSGEQCYKARKGVLLACGGFENDQEMISSFYQIGYYKTLPLGTPYNRGDGIRMAQSVGAALWHTNNFSNGGLSVRWEGSDNPVVTAILIPTKDYIYVGPDATRFAYEETMSLARHGKYPYDGDPTNLRAPVPMHAIFGSEAFNGDCIVPAQLLSATWINSYDLYLGEKNQDYLDAGVIVSADTIEELAGKIGLDPVRLKTTMDDYNKNAALGSDPEFKRGTEVFSDFQMSEQTKEVDTGENAGSTEGLKPAVAPFELKPIESPYYAVELYMGTLNTQGGPKRGAKGEVLNTRGEAIPRLYAAGEMGCIYSYNYNGGGNVSEALSSGRLAARSIGALEPWEA